MTISVKPVAFVTNSRKEPTDDHWNAIISTIELADHIPDDVFLNIDQFSHLEIIFYFDKVSDDSIVFSGIPRGNSAYPITGIFAQRKKTGRIRSGFARLNCFLMKAE